MTWSFIVFCVVAYVQGHWYANVYVYVLCHSHVSISMCGRYIGIWMSVYISFILIVLFTGFTVFIFWHWQVAEDGGCLCRKCPTLLPKHFVVGH